MMRIPLPYSKLATSQTDSAFHSGKDGLHFRAGQHHRQAFGRFRLRHIVQPGQIVAISNERILGMEGSIVRFRVRDSANGNRKKLMRMNATEFIERFLLHVLPSGFKRIRHYGLLGPASKAAKLAAARVALAAPVPDPAVVESVEEFMRRVAYCEWMTCPHCRNGRFIVLEGIPPAPERLPGCLDPP